MLINPIERVVCSGGGAKGIGSPGCYTAMEETGLLKGVKAFSGASAGAISTAFMAVGTPTPLLRKYLHAANLKELLGPRVGRLFARNELGVSVMTRDGKPLEQFIRQHLIETVSAFLADLPVGSLAPDVNKILKKLKQKNPRFTFGDLAVLNHHYPDRFKQLVIPAAQFPSGKLFIFNSELTPNVEIALACRASASIPVIMEPVEIEIDGHKQKFVDGGIYDNLPTDYFDKNDNGQFTKNQKPRQTLIFAFGEGLDNNKNSVFQALYGHRWDEVINDNLLEEIIDAAMKLSQCSPHLRQNSTKEEAKRLNLALHSVLTHQVRDKKITIAESKIVMSAIKRTIDGTLTNSQSNQQFWAAYQQATNQQHRVKLIKEKMKPILFTPGRFETWKRDVLIETLGDLHLPYKNTVQKELGYQKLRTEYAQRTIELRVGHIETRDFDKATKLARLMDALGYLDTMNHITNHGLYDPKAFDAEKCYTDLVRHFESIYKAVLYGAGKDPNKNILIAEISSLRRQIKQSGKSEALISKQIMHLVKDRVENQLGSIAAFALSRAVAFRNRVLTADELFKETYEEAFKQSGFIAVSNITGKRIYSIKALRVALMGKSMLALYHQQVTSREITRTDKVFDALQTLNIFPMLKPTIDSQPMRALHYAPAIFARNRYHFFAATTEQYKHLNKSLIGLKGDQLKTEILSAFKTSLATVTSKEELQLKRQAFYASNEYKILAKGQGIATRLFCLETSSVKAVKEIIEDAERLIEEKSMNCFITN